MTNKPHRPFEKLLSTLAILSVLPSSGWARQGIYKEFLSGSEIITVSGEQVDEHHARIDAVQIAHDQYHEIRILNPNTGATEILEFSDPKLQMTYTLPFHGKFLKLQIKRREKDGLRTADFALASDESHYIPLRQNFRKYRAFRQDIDLGGIAVCKMPQQSLVNKAGIDPVIDALLDTPQNIATRCLDSSCQKEPFLSEYRHILGGISQVIASRDSKSSNSQRFLACLNDNQLGYFAEKLKTYFTDSLKPSSKPTVVCANNNNGTRGEFFENENPDAATINLNRPWAYSSNTEPESDAQSFYADTFFHESLHRVGLEDEDITADAVSCCGMESSDGSPAACAKVKEGVEQINKRNAGVLASMEKLDGFKDFWLQIQQSNDEDQANALYDDFFELLSSKKGADGKSPAACLSIPGDDTEECLQNFVSATDKTIDEYFTNTCPLHASGRSKSAKATQCQSLGAQAKSILQTNLNKVCDPSKNTTFEKSCLFAVRTKKQELLAQAKKDGDLIEAPEEDTSSAKSEKEEKIRNAVLTAFRNQIPGIEAAFNNFKDDVNDAVHSKRAQSIFSDLIGYMARKARKISSSYEKCIAQGSDKSTCANKAKDYFLNSENGLSHFFKKECPKVFTTSEMAKKPCDEINQKLTQAFNASFSGGCKTSDPSKQIGVPGNDLTCLFNALAESKYNIANYDELEKDGKLINTKSLANGAVAPQEAKNVADNVAMADGQKPQSIRIGDQSSKSTNRSSSTPIASHKSGHSAHRSPASSQGPVYAYDPGNGFEDRLKSELAQQPAPARKVLQDAGRVLADLAVPRAQAETRREADTSALTIPAPMPLTSQGAQAFAARASIAGDVEAATQAIRTGTMGSSPSSAARKSLVTKNGVADPREKAQSTSAKSAADTRSGASSDKQTGRSPASTSATSKSAAKASASKRGQTASASTASEQHADHDSKASEASDSLHHLQNRLLKHFKDDPKGALARLKSGALSNELRSYFIEVKDDEGHAYGSNSPKIKIWYDQAAGVFEGLPDL